MVPDIIVTCLTYALVLDGLDNVGGLDCLALERTPVLCVSTALMLLIMTCQNTKRHHIIPDVVHLTIIRYLFLEANH